VKEIATCAPRIGIITDRRNYERFRTMRNIEETNYEAIATLPPDGLAVFNCEGEHG
jgi:hypothetical protein